MKLCIISPFPPALSGVGQYGWHVAGGLAATGCFKSVTVLAESTPAERSPVTESVSAGPLTVRRIWRRDDPTSALRLLRAVLVERPDVLWFNAGLTMFGRRRGANFLGLLVPALAQQMGVPVVATLHELVETARLASLGTPNGAFTHWGARLATRGLLRVEAVVVTLRRYAEVLRESYHAHHVYHLPHGAFTPVAPLPRPDDAPPLDTLCFTSLAPHRGLPVLLDAFDSVRAALPAATLTIAGGDHPRYPGYTAQLRAARNGQAGLHWLGAQSEHELLTAFARARVVALPYLATTGASSVLYRAAAVARPVIVSDLPDTRAAADEAGLRVIFTPPGDSAALADALRALLADPAQQAMLAEHNLCAMSAATLARTCERYVELLTRLARA
jgi:glycosyltransferase involved in cell wall biosynthesis